MLLGFGYLIIITSSQQVRNLPSNVPGQILNSIILDISTPDKVEQLSAVPCLKPITNRGYSAEQRAASGQIVIGEKESIRQAATSISCLDSDNLIFLGTDLNAEQIFNSPAAAVIPDHVVQRAIRHVSESETETPTKVKVQMDGNNNNNDDGSDKAKNQQSDESDSSPTKYTSENEGKFPSFVPTLKENKWCNVKTSNLNPNDALVTNIFDSHCHLDRIYSYWKHAKVPNPLENLSQKFPAVFGSKFEGCISVNCDPRNWKVISHFKPWPKINRRFSI